MVKFAQYELERVAIKPTARMHWQRRRFVNHDDRFVFVKNSNVSIDVRLLRERLNMNVSLTGSDNFFGRDRMIQFGF